MPISDDRRVTMRYRSSLLTAAAAVLVTLCATPVLAAPESKPTITEAPFSFELIDNACTHESGTLSGTLRILSSVTQDPDGGFRFVSRSRYLDASFVADDGSIYRLTSNAGSTYINQNGTGFPAHVTSTGTFNLVGPDGQFHGHSVYTVTVNANGETTVVFLGGEVDCNF